MKYISFHLYRKTTDQALIEDPNMDFLNSLILCLLLLMKLTILLLCLPVIFSEFLDEKSGPGCSIRDVI